jgi:hypothetical protein
LRSPFIEGDGVRQNAQTNCSHAGLERASELEGVGDAVLAQPD